MICQLLEKQRYVRTALANSVECGCGNRKCTGASRCTRPIRRISSAKKQSKRANLGIKLQEKRISAVGEVSVRIHISALSEMMSKLSKANIGSLRGQYEAEYATFNFHWRICWGVFLKPVILLIVGQLTKN